MYLCNLSSETHRCHDLAHILTGLSQGCVDQESADESGHEADGHVVQEIVPRARTERDDDSQK